jgi:hypothetical protein
MTYFQTLKNKLHNLFGLKKQSKFTFKKNKVDFIALPEDMSEKERLTWFAEALKKQGWTVTDKQGLLDKLDK